MPVESLPASLGSRGSSDGAGEGRRDRQLARVPALLLCAIAFGQFSCAHFGTLTPWKGGGFGMFSTIDHPGNRRLILKGVDYAGATCVIGLRPGRHSVPNVLSASSLSRLVAFPSVRHLEGIAEAVLNGRVVATPAPSIRILHEYLEQKVVSELAATKYLEIVGPIRLPGDSVRLKEVHATVVTLAFEGSSRMLAVRQVLPPVVVHGELPPTTLGSSRR